VTILEADVVVLGCGPAGATFAINLAPFCRVLIVDRLAGPRRRIGESLAPAARRLLTDMGLWGDFLAQGHTPCHGQVSLWGGPEPLESRAMRDPDGPGWHLDRPRFDGWLREIAVDRGAALLAPATLRHLVREAGEWRIDLAMEGRTVRVRSPIVVDAAGRGASLARMLGSRRIVHDRLVCGWLYGRDTTRSQAGLTQIEAEADGWWYTAPLPGDRRVIAFHTDSDLPAARIARDQIALIGRATTLPYLAGILQGNGFRAESDGGGFCAAPSTSLAPALGDGWLAVGDAALGFDPLSSQGLFQALHSGLAGAEAVHRSRVGEPEAWLDYQSRLDAVANAYRSQLRAWYGLERRWADRPFWQRRIEDSSP
jgi:flavin-dependent dehydrogenase